MGRDADIRMEQEQIAHARILQDVEQRARQAKSLGGAGLKETSPDCGNQRAMCARETARTCIINYIERLDRERAGLVALLDVLPPALHQFHPQADEALFELVSRRR